MRAAGLFALACLAAVGCGDQYYAHIGINASARGGIPMLQQVGDSIRVFASEWIQRPYETEDMSVPSSDGAAHLYDWTSTNPQVAEVRKGWLVMLSLGETTIRVKTPNAAASAPVFVCSPTTSLRITPRDPVLNVGESITIEVKLIQETGECGRTSQSLRISPWRANPPLTRTGMFGPWTATRSGTGWYVASEQFAGRNLRDSILVTVK